MPRLVPRLVLFPRLAIGLLSHWARTSTWTLAPGLCPLEPLAITVRRGLGIEVQVDSGQGHSTALKKLDVSLAIATHNAEP